MKKTITLFKLPFVLLLTFISIVACDKEFSEIESDVLGQDNTNLSTNKIGIPIIAYNKKLEALQIDNLKASLLGVYNDPNFGQTTASIVTQLTPKTFNPNFGTDPVIDSVILKIPYFNRLSGSDYTINDSLYGKTAQGTAKPFKLSIYQTNYYLNHNGSTNYYSKSDGTVINETTMVDFNTKNLSALNYILDKTKPDEVLPLENINLTPSSTPDFKGIEPSIYYRLERDFWKDKIISIQDQTELSNTNNFRNYFRGLHFKAEAESGDGSMVMLNLDDPDANITIYYTSGASDSRKQSTYVLNFSGNKVNTFINEYYTEILNELKDDKIDKVNGDDFIYLKGANGSMAVVNLFENEVALTAFYDEFRVPDGNGGYVKEEGSSNFKLKKLINDAQLIVYEYKNLLNKDAHKYDRIYAYNIIDNTATVDYLLDPTQNLQSPYNSNVISLGKRIEDGNGNYKYKIRLTEHLKSLLLTGDDKPETKKIGLVLSTNVNLTGQSKILDATGDVTEVPAASIITPRGTILYGNVVSGEDENKKMRLEIFVTESK